MILRFYNILYICTVVCSSMYAIRFFDVAHSINKDIKAYWATAG